MSATEFYEWQEYLATVPSVQELQMAHLLYIQAIKAGVKNIDVEDFLITRDTTKEKNSKDFESLTEEDINKIAGVA